jgi:hypothetical protein
MARLFYLHREEDSVRTYIVANINQNRFCVELTVRSHLQIIINADQLQKDSMKRRLDM